MPFPLDKRTKKRLLLILHSGVIGGLIGLSCMFLPEAWHAPCHLAVKILTLFAGGH